MTSTQLLFLRRFNEELEGRGWTPTELSKKRGAPPQRTIAEAITRVNPTIATLHKISEGLGMEAWELLTERRHPSRKTASVVALDQPKPFGALSKSVLPRARRHRRS